MIIDFVASYSVLYNYKANRYLNQKHPGCKKEQPRTKKGLDKKEMKSKWAAKACVVLLLIKVKI